MDQRQISKMRIEGTPASELYDKTKCNNCGDTKAKLSPWVGEGGVSEYIHGHYWYWCEKCQVEAQLEYAEKQAGRIKDLQARLLELKGKV